MQFRGQLGTSLAHPSRARKQAVPALCQLAPTLTVAAQKVSPFCRAGLNSELSGLNYERPGIESTLFGFQSWRPRLTSARSGLKCGCHGINYARFG